MLDYAAPSLFQPHRARQALRDAHEGKISPLVGIYFGLSSIPMARHIAPFGFDVAWVDWEHSSCNVETMTTMVHELIFMSSGRTIPFVRVPGHDHASIGYALDAGASLIVPQVDTVAQARHVISAAKFGSRSGGTRSAPPFRLIPGLTDIPANPALTLHENLNAQAAIIIQVETLAAIHNLDAILAACPQIDAVWLGSLDARVSMNLPGNGGMGGEEPEWLDALALYNATMKKHNKPRAGFAFGPTREVKREMARGKSFVVTSADVLAFVALGRELEEGREVFEKNAFPPVGIREPGEEKEKEVVVVNGHAKKAEKAEEGFVAVNGVGKAA
ncbi:MAG: hypothetical protein Q9160_002303 [Pyrenula sp. 1 TL-2023]